jgi:hypothetical protein
MARSAHTTVAFEIHRLGAAGARANAGAGLKLLPSADGWSLVGPQGELVYQALGTAGRRRCPEYARAHGVLAVYS